MTLLATLLAELSSGDDDRAEAAAQQIARYGAEALPGLQNLLTGGDADARWWGVRALAGIVDPRVTLILTDALRDPEDAVRRCAALALRQHPTPQIIPKLVAALASEDLLLARLAADALIAIGPPAVAALLDVAQDDSHPGRVEAIRALALIGDLSAIPALCAALDGDSALADYWASEGLERMGVGMVYFKP